MDDVKTPFYDNDLAAKITEDGKAIVRKMTADVDRKHLQDELTSLWNRFVEDHGTMAWNITSEPSQAQRRLREDQKQAVLNFNRKRNP